MESVKVKILKQTVAGKKQVKVGDIVTLEKSEAIFLVGIGKATEKFTEENQEDSVVLDDQELSEAPIVPEKQTKTKKGK